MKKVMFFPMKTPSIQEGGRVSGRSGAECVACAFQFRYLQVQRMMGQKACAHVEEERVVM